MSLSLLTCLSLYWRVSLYTDVSLSILTCLSLYWRVSLFPDVSLSCNRTDCCFSPDDKLLLTGSSVKKDEGNGKLQFFERDSLQKVYEIEVADAVGLADNYTCNVSRSQNMIWRSAMHYGTLGLFHSAASLWGQTWPRLQSRTRWFHLYIFNIYVKLTFSYLLN